MCMEKELGRIADALERIEQKLSPAVLVDRETGAETTYEKVIPKKKGKKAAPKAAPAVADFGGGEAEPAGEPVAQKMTSEELLKYANKQILAVSDLKKRSKIVQQLKAMFKENYGVTSVKAIPADKVDECKAAFSLIMEAGR